MMKYIYPSLFLFSIMFAQHNPIQTATAGAYHARLFGNQAIQNNPALLGKFGEKIVLGSVEIDSLIIEVPDSLNTQENDSNIKEFEAKNQELLELCTHIELVITNIHKIDKSFNENDCTIELNKHL